MVFIQKTNEKVGKVGNNNVFNRKQLKKLEKLEIAMILAGKQLRCLDSPPKP